MKVFTLSRLRGLCVLHTDEDMGCRGKLIDCRLLEGQPLQWSTHR
jgi:hypothetical protein